VTAGGKGLAALSFCRLSLLGFSLTIIKDPGNGSPMLGDCTAQKPRCSKNAKFLLVKLATLLEVSFRLSSV
jgi:hypothetical protein